MCVCMCVCVCVCVCMVYGCTVDITFCVYMSLYSNMTRHMFLSRFILCHKSCPLYILQKCLKHFGLSVMELLQ